MVKDKSPLLLNLEALSLWFLSTIVFSKMDFGLQNNDILVILSNSIQMDIGYTWILGKNFSSIQLANMDSNYWLVRHQVEGEKLLFQPGASNTFSKYMKIWCNIQLIMYRFFTLSFNSKILFQKVYAVLNKICSAFSLGIQSRD